MGKRAFSIVEILVVIAIIAILAALTFPVFAAAKSRAKDVTCLANLRQIGIALTSYSASNDDLLPTESSTPISPVLPHPILVALKPYGMRDELLQCPKDFYLDFGSGTIDYENNHYKRCGSSYDFNLVLGKYSMTGVPAPSKAGLASDFFSFHSAQNDAKQWFQVLFFDGHVKKEDWARRTEFLFVPQP